MLLSFCHDKCILVIAGGFFMLLTEKELCENLKVERVFLYKCRQSGLPFVRLGPKIIRYDYDSVLKWFKDNYSTESLEMQKTKAETLELLKFHSKGCCFYD